LVIGSIAIASQFDVHAMIGLLFSSQIIA